MIDSIAPVNGMAAAELLHAQQASKVAERRAPVQEETQVVLRAPAPGPVPAPAPAQALVQQAQAQAQPASERANAVSVEISSSAQAKLLYSQGQNVTLIAQSLGHDLATINLWLGIAG
ncbi:MAG: hypothetical protein WCQ50_19750 [Spirochaetota bacterium]